MISPQQTMHRAFSLTLLHAGSQVADPGLVSAIAHLLGINGADLSRVLTTSNLSTRGEVISKSNTISESISIRNAFAKGLYSRLFDYVVQVINKLLSYSLQVMITI
jgi:myosin heavy subunit